MKKILILFFLVDSFSASSQIGVHTLAGNTIHTAVPFLRISPDACSSGMGDVGIATTPNLNSIYWNTAKLSFENKKSGIGFSYSPWLKQLVNDIFLADLSWFKKIDSANSLTASMRYFSLGSIVFTDISGQTTTGNYNPREFTTHIGYSRKLTKNFSTGINLGYIYSNLASGQSVNNVPIKAGTALATDLSFYYSHTVLKKKKLREYDFGITLSDLGTKITYIQSAEERSTLPLNLGAGSAFHFQFSKNNLLTLAIDANKILVPSSNSALNFSAGTEYVFHSHFVLRGGYFYMLPQFENRQHLSSGMGLRWRKIVMDASYLFATFNSKNPIDNTFRFSLSFQFPSERKR